MKNQEHDDPLVELDRDMGAYTEHSNGQSTRYGVLVADSDHMIRSMVQLGLELKGFEVWMACDGLEAIDLYRLYREKIDAVLLDVYMPRMDAPQALRTIRELNPKVRACFMSGVEAVDIYNLDDLRESVGGYFINKPFYIDQLARVLRQLVKGKSPDLTQPDCAHLEIDANAGHCDGY